MKSLDEMTEGELEFLMNRVASNVKSLLPLHTGFILLASPFGASSIAQYISNGTRKECIQWLRETADRLERRETDERVPF